MGKESAARVVPFAVFMAFIGANEVLSLLAEHLPFGLTNQHAQYLYPVRVAAAAVLLWLFRSSYGEVSFSDLGRSAHTFASLLLGGMVFLVWITLDQSFSLAPSAAAGYDPALFPGGGVRVAMVAARILGAVVVVPVMEELFWRSFLTRYLISSSFMEVKIGVFTVFSFLATSVLFGLEHNLILAGIFAGIVYNAILFYTKSISQCIVSHAFTNALLAGYVLATGKWMFW